MKTYEPEQVRFGEFELNVRSGELFSIGKGAAKAASTGVVLREQAFQILRILVERQGRLVTRQEIRQILWPSGDVSEVDRSINVAMAILRKALGDDADHPTYIQTLARRGYRLITPVEWQQSSTDALELREPRDGTLASVEENTIEHQLRTPKHLRRAAAFGVIVVVLAAGYVSWGRVREPRTPRSTRVMLAVLPFENLTGDPSKEYLADGLTEEMISQLARLDPNELGVIGRTSVMGYKHKDERLDQVGHELAVQYVLENSLRQSGDRLRITSQLIQVRDQSHLWAHDYDYRAQDVLTLEENVASAVAREIQLRLAARPQTDSAHRQPLNPEAFDAYLQGHYFFEKNTDKDTYMAAQYYERATQLDPSFALAWVGLGRVRKWEGSRELIPMQEGYRLAREAIERALALDPNLAAAHIQMARIKSQIDFDWAGADGFYQRAARAEPGNAEVVRDLAYWALALGQLDKALRLDRQAVELDPLNAQSWGALAETELSAGRLDEAAAHGEKALDLSADVWPGPILLSKIYLMQGRPKDALPVIERVRYDHMRAYLYAMAYYALGRKTESDSVLNDFIAKYSRDTYALAEIYAFRNQPDEAFTWLDRAYAQRNDGLHSMKLDPLLESLRHDARYAALLKKLNFPT